MTATANPPSVGQRARHLVPVIALVAWTLFVWVGRVRNILDDTALAGWSRTWRLGLALSFVLLAVAVATLGLRHLLAGRGGVLPVGAGAPPLLTCLTAALAAYGIVVWAIRGTDIALGAHGTAFKVVHSILAVVTIALGAIALRWAASHRS